MDNTLTPAGNGSNNKTLWTAIIVLGIVVLAMGAMLLRMQGNDARNQVAAVTPPAAAASDIITESKAPVATEKAASPAPEPVVKAPVKTKAPAPVHTATPKPVQPNAPEPAVARAPAPAEPVKTICANCGTVERVTPVEQEGAGSGVGAIAGGVLGALVGNQIGGGSGKSLATVAGAIGGGIAGNTVEKKMNKVTHYEVQVRMEDGSTRTLRQATPVAAGTRVIVDGNTLRSAAP